MGNTTKIIVPPAAGYMLYKAYKSGTLSSLKDKIWHHDSTQSGTIPTPDESLAGAQQTLGTASPFHGDTLPVEEADTIHGQPAENVDFDPTVYQFYPDTCAIQSQHLVLQQYGIDVTQEELIEVAKEHGWYAEGYGTPINMVGKLLEHYGVDVTGSQGNNIFNLSNELAQGHQVIVGVDADELIDPEGSIGVDETYGEHANHALVVVGVDTTDPDNVQVIVTDPGTGNRQMAYPADQFIDAWKDSNCFMVSTDTVPTHPELYPMQAIDQFGSLPTETLQRLSDADMALGHPDDFSGFISDLNAHPEQLDDLIMHYDTLFPHAADDDFTEWDANTGDV